MGKKLTQKEFEEKVYDMFGGEVTVVGDYTGANTKIKVQDAYGICEVFPSNLLSGHKPSIKTAVNQNEYFQNQINNIFNGKIKVIGEYINDRTKIRVQTKYGICNVKPSNLLRGQKPSILTAVNQNEYFINQVNDMFGGEITVIGEYVNARTKIKVRTKYGLYLCKPNNLLRGQKPSIQTAINKNEYFIKQINDMFGGEIIVVGEYVNNKTKILVQDKFSVCSVLPDSLLHGYKPSIQTAINKNEYFINQAREIHEDKYDYSKVEYQGANKKVEIICSKHGSFKQLPNNHLQSQGCPLCGNDGKDGGYNETLAERNKEEWLKIPAIVYLIKCWADNESESEVFYKCGITKNTVQKRFYSKKSMPYNYDILQEYHTDLYHATILESVYHNYYQIKKQQQYEPLIKFNGHTECFILKENENVLMVEEVLNQLITKFVNND